MGDLVSTRWNGTCFIIGVDFNGDDTVEWDGNVVVEDKTARRKLTTV